MKIKEEDARNIIQTRICKGLLGPGSDIWGNPDAEEIISDYPLQRYFTGILFPRKDIVRTEDEEDSANIEIETDDLDNDGLDVNTSDKEENISTETENENLIDDNKIKEEIKIDHNNFYPTNMGLTFCVDRKVNTIEADFNFGLYFQPKYDEIKIVVTTDIFKAFLNNDAFPFKDLLIFDNGFLSLKRPLEGYKGGGGKERSGEYLLYDEFRNSDTLKNDQILNSNFHLFEKLISRAWKRKDIKKQVELELSNSDGVIYEEDISKNNKLSIHYFIKMYELDNKKYIKILIANQSTPQPKNKFSNKNEILNRKGVFQTELCISSNYLEPYKSYNELNPFDDEAQILNYLYRDVQNYCIGHNTSVIWDNEHEKPRWIKTTFLPEYDIKELKNDFTEKDFQNPEQQKVFDTILNLKNLSHFGFKQNEILTRLKSFVDYYGDWIDKQKQINRDQGDKVKIGYKLIQNLEDNYNRLKDNIKYLEDEKIFRCFQLANTAMYIQLIISSDENFSKKEKYLSELSSEISYNDIEYFINHAYIKPKYRPFQLAFFLLNLDGIVNLNSKSRNEIVDLLWFPTGGGKTEAYLALSAFTIIWRRMNHPENYDGTSVIMRYTLRLLTAQQFERASRLIVSLEFLRNHFKQEMKDSPITIGLWVGMASTPNKIDEAKEKIDIINRECERGNNGSPEEKNVFQISSCPWCGSKLISKNTNGAWRYGFQMYDRNRKFRIECLNPKCPYHGGLPVQVVDQMLYLNPPTLLFATVDKFAMLAWQEDGHVFFNSLDETKLPPDLIIQDELHLLNGPLGSITGIFESVVELLSTRENYKPKILASTATTRNTSYQIEKLYGNRKVNIFPPSGLNINDSYFARETKEEKKRRYVGFMPTGKTALDTQLQLLSHLLVSRVEIFKNENLRGIIDKYWTIVSYYNSLKDVGKIANKIDDEVNTFLRALQIRLFGEDQDLTFNYYGLPNRQKELTSRIESYQIKLILKEMEEKIFSPDKIKKKEKGYTLIQDVIDLILATNMISVGIDIGRLNIMLVNGQPKNIAEYIQATSRVCRRTKGLVITSFDANRARDKSYFEHFIPFHQAFYKSIEPLSITPFTENTIDKMATSLMITHVRHKIGRNKNSDAQYFTPEDLESLKTFIKSRFNENSNEYDIFEQRLNKLAKEWEENTNPVNEDEIPYKKYSELMKKPAQKDVAEDNDWIVMQSMREIDTNTFIQIKEDYTINSNNRN